jgi:hypothetical protein
VLRARILGSEIQIAVDERRLSRSRVKYDATPHSYRVTIFTSPKEGKLLRAVNLIEVMHRKVDQRKSFSQSYVRMAFYAALQHKGLTEYDALS